MIKGDSSDTVDLNGWTSAGTVTNSGTTYTVYNSGSYAQVLVQSGKATVQSSETGTAYLVKSTINVTNEAILREKQIKGGSRQKKIALIDTLNPQWLDLYEKLL